MRIISKRKLRDYYSENVQAVLPLSEWYYKMKHVKAGSLSELRLYFNSVDAAYGYTIFNIGGNNYRLITAIHYMSQVCYVRMVWTHAEYSKRSNQSKLERGQL